jgi:hypothetical protein
LPPSDMEQPCQNPPMSPPAGTTPTSTTPDSKGIWRIDQDTIEGSGDR